MGVTRLSLGVENFDDEILELNGRAHRSPEIFRAYEFARSLGFPQINIDLIAGMLGETDENWRDCVEKTLELQPDSVTIYQMELPFNTTISGDLLKGTGRFARAGRRLVDEAAVGGGGVRGARGGRLPRRQRLHRGRRIRTARVSSTAIVSGRARTWWASVWRRSAMSTVCTCRTSIRGRPTRPRSGAARFRSSRAYRPTDEERLIRELILQLKLGSIRPAYFREKYRRQRPRALPRSARLARGGRATCSRRPSSVSRSRARGCCASTPCFKRFFLPEHAGIRYT